MQKAFVIQEHHARRLHFDFRLSDGKVLKSWAVTKEPAMDWSIRRLAIETEDHPLEYADFEGEIPKGEYGAGSVSIWDRGTYEVIARRPGRKPDLARDYDEGTIEVLLRGKKLKGRFLLVRIAGEGTRSQWLFFKKRPQIGALRISPSAKRSASGRP